MKRLLYATLRKAGLMRTANALNNRRLGVRKWRARRRHESDLEVVYNEKFFADIHALTEESAPAVAETFLEAFRPRSVTDVGCGTGVYLAEFQKRGVAVRGIEGSAKALQQATVSRDLITIHDLRTPLPPLPPADVVICFETAEHINPAHTDTFVANVAGLGGTILFTAAPPGQGGTDHINERPREFWIAAFGKHGFSYDAAETSRLSRLLKERKAVWYLPDNLFIFRRAGTSNRRS